MKDTAIDVDDLKNFLDYLQDKVENCYKNETERAIKEYLEEISE